MKQGKTMPANFYENRQIRIFISSTFRDMQDERGYLVTKVFPALRRHCEEREVSIFELDLRWGISEEEAKQGKVFDICLKEVLKTRPFFIGLLGERYGWVPSEGERKAMAENTNIFSDYPWITAELDEGTSITEIEIQEGVLRAKEPINAYFYLRSPKMETPDGFREKQGSHEEKMLSELKRIIREQKEHPVHEYDSIERLGTLVEQDFKALVDRLFPESALPPLEKERLQQRNFLKSRTMVYVQNPAWYAELDAFVHSAERGMVITGANGMGKSALLANWITRRQGQNTPNEKLIYHFIGVSQSGGDYRKITQRLIDEIRDIYNIPVRQNDYAPLQEPKGEDKQKEELQNLLFSLAENKKIIIILDGVDRLNETDNAKLLNWIPPMPDSVKLICSTLPDDASMEAFNRRGYRQLAVNVLETENRNRLVNGYLKSFSKALTPVQSRRIAADGKSENPLVMLAILDELRVFGVHEKMDEQIGLCLAAPDSESLFALLLQRIEEVFSSTNAQKNYVKDILSLITVSRSGLSETEILGLSGAAPLYWSQLSNGMAGHLTTMNGLVSFSNSLMQNAVKKQYLPDSAEENAYRLRIAAYMETGASFERKCGELPHQLYELEEWDRLYNFLLDIKVFQYIYKKDQFELGKYWRALREANLKNSIEHETKFHADSGRFTMEKYLELDNAFEDKDGLHSFYGNIIVFIQDIFADDSSNSLNLEFALKNNELCNELYGRASEKTAFSLDLIGIAYFNLLSRKCLGYHKEALEIRKEIYRNDNQFIAFSYSKIGGCYINADKYQAAIENFQKALEIQLKVPGEKSFDTASTYNNLGFCFNKGLGEYQKALGYYEKALRTVEELLGKNHSYTGTVCNNVGLCYYRMGNYAKALEYLTISFSVFEKRLDKGNPMLAQNCENIAFIYQKSNDYKNALEYYEKTLELKKEQSGENHAGVALSCKLIGSCYYELGDNTEALEHYNQALTIYSRLEGQEEEADNVRQSIERMSKEQ
jgi:tetratricopeptide (TPR) repeat protein